MFILISRTYWKTQHGGCQMEWFSVASAETLSSHLRIWTASIWTRCTTSLWLMVELKMVRYCFFDSLLLFVFIGSSIKRLSFSFSRANPSTWPPASDFNLSDSHNGTSWGSNWFSIAPAHEISWWGQIMKLYILNVIYNMLFSELYSAFECWIKYMTWFSPALQKKGGGYWRIPWGWTFLGLSCYF